MRARECLEVFGQTPAAPQPAERAFHNPALLEHHKSLCGVRALHDLKLGPCRPTHRPGRLTALIGPVRDHPLQKGKEPPHLFQNTETAIPILHVARQNGAAEHQAERVNDGMALAPFDLLGRIIADRIDRAPPPFGSFHALAVHDRRRGAGLLAGQLAGLLVESMMQTPQRAVTLPTYEVVVHGTARGQVLGQGAPLTARAEDVEHGVDHLAQNNPALPARPARRDVHEGTGQLPFGIGHISWVTQALAVVGATGLGLPHQRASSTSSADQGITTASQHSTFLRTGSKVMAELKKATINDMFTENGKIRADGLMEHDMYVMQVKTPAESKQPWAYYKLVQTMPSDRAFGSLAETDCPLVKRH